MHASWASISGRPWRVKPPSPVTPTNIRGPPVQRGLHQIPWHPHHSNPLSHMVEHAFSGRDNKAVDALRKSPLHNYSNTHTTHSLWCRGHVRTAPGSLSLSPPPRAFTRTDAARKLLASPPLTPLMGCSMSRCLARVIAPSTPTSPRFFPRVLFNLLTSEIPTCTQRIFIKISFMVRCSNC